MGRKLQYWIKERNNPQAGTYYSACGMLTVKAAREKTKTLYGHNTMHSYPSEAEYLAAIKRLKDAGETVY